MGRPPAWRRGPVVGLVALLVLLAGTYLAGLAGGDPAGRDGTAQLAPATSSPGPGPGTGTGTGPASGSASGTGTRSTDGDGLTVVGLADLPVEVAETVDLIAAGGPFPEDEDGRTFMNREGLLPAREEGWYREYTVPTPGEDDRGARRVVAGADGTLYFTADHYDSFVVVGGVG